MYSSAILNSPMLPSKNANIENINGKYNIFGDFKININDFQIQIPPILASNIAKTIFFRYNINDIL